ncbi:MalY/PatB family protein [Hallella multisaccharivorax]|uniref:MalY/PatB family protein n=1 Tax=Hallella multisaccharivorax TaxID=310514 RepID=UPI003617414B
MKYDFDRVVPRRHSGSYKWDAIPEDTLPLWVADMDFEVAPAIKQALAERVGHGIFGYTQVDDDYYEAVISWFSRRHQWQIRRQWMLYTSGVVPAISCSIKALALPGEKVLVQTPVYNCFFSSIRNQGCEVLESRLLRKDDSYVIDWDDFERKCADEKTTVFLLCNPHNPAGRVWTRDELERMGTICRRHHVFVISDEIHCELTMPGFTFTPFAAVGEVNLANSVTLNSPSKSFNTAGLQIANIICEDDEVRRRIDRVINIYEVCDVNPFGPVALKAAYNESEGWIDALNDYIYGNYQLLRSVFASDLPLVEVIRLEGTYLAWVDIRGLGMSSGAVTEKLLHNGHVFVSEGTLYGKDAGEGYIRINLACPRAVLKEGLNRIVRALA